MNVEYKDLTIRPVNLDDAELLLSWYNDGSIMAFDGYPHGKRTKEVIIKHYINHDTKYYRHLILYKNKEIGEINYRDTNDGSCNIYINIADKNYQNIGLGKLALSLFIDVLFNDYGFKKVRAETYKSNPRSAHVFEKLGFTKTSEHENNRSDTDGYPMSTMDYELVPENFISYID